jgi:hypothetical protein
MTAQTYHDSREGAETETNRGLRMKMEKTYQRFREVVG